MPVDQRTERCRRHPGLPAVAACDRCGSPLCLDCAVPVRGRVLDAPCLGIDSTPPEPSPRGLGTLAPWVGVGFVIATLAGALPWRKYGLGSGPFGAWGTDLRWSLVAAVAALAGLGLWLLAVIRGWPWDGPWRIGARWLSAVCVAGAVLHLLRPPIVGPQSYGATVAIVGGVVAFAGTFVRRPA